MPIANFMHYPLGYPITNFYPFFPLDNDKVKPFKCNICDYMTKNKEAFDRHVETFHKKIKPFNCTSCDYTTEDENDLKTHKETIHDVAFECKIFDSVSENSDKTSLEKENSTNHIESRGKYFAKIDLFFL